MQLPKEIGLLFMDLFLESIDLFTLKTYFFQFFFYKEGTLFEKSEGKSNVNSNVHFVGHPTSHLKFIRVKQVAEK